MTESLLFDIETNEPGDFRTLRDLERVHTIVLTDWTKPGYRPAAYFDDPRGEVRHPRVGGVAEGVQRLRNAKRLAGHNILSFDLPALEKLYPVKFDRARAIDTIVLSRLCWPDLLHKDLDIKRIPQGLAGNHSLEAWGHRLGEHKGVDYKSREDAWSLLTTEMVDYCAQDVAANAALLAYFLKQPLSSAAVQREHRFADVLVRQMARGAHFDQERAWALVSKLESERAELEEALADMVPPFHDVRFTPKQRLRREVTTRFNPRSRAHICRHLTERRDWKPRALTPTGKPKMDEAILGRLAKRFEECQLLARHAVLTKILGYLADGQTAWTKLVTEESRVHGSILHIGTVTHRCSHARPNLGNVPKTGPLGHACRSLFTATPGLTMVGADASGLELRCLANRLAPYDDGAFGRLIDEGDVHQNTADVAGVDRDTGKRLMYALLYGAGDKKLGTIVGGGAKGGAEVRSKLLQGVVGLDRLTEDCRRQHGDSGAIQGLDGRRVPTRSEHSALNTALQSDGAIVMKEAVNRLDDALSGLPAWQVLQVHDEMQVEASPAVVSKVADAAVASIVEAGPALGFRCPLRAEAKVGADWSETH